MIQMNFAADGSIMGESDGIARTVAILAPAAWRGKRRLCLDSQTAAQFPADAARYTFDLPAGSHRIEIKPHR